MSSRLTASIPSWSVALATQVLLPPTPTDDGISHTCVDVRLASIIERFSANAVIRLSAQVPVTQNAVRQRSELALAQHVSQESCMIAGMEACIANLVEPGDTVVVGNNGIWGARVVDMAGRFGGEQLMRLLTNFCVCVRSSIAMQLQHGHPVALVNATSSGSSAQHSGDM